MATISSILKLRIFTLNDVIDKLQMSRSAAAAALVRWQRQGVIAMVRRNMYAAIDPATEAPIVDKFELASAISPFSYVGWHTALEFHGIAHQPFYNAFVGIEKRFSDFRFDGIDYLACPSPYDATEENGVITPIGNPYVRVSDLERTIVDCCDRIERAGGLEELLHCLESVSLLNEDKLTKYLALYKKAFLYQKVGFVLEQTREHHGISEEFIEMCRAKGAIHPKRMTNDNDSDQYVCRWKLYVPANCITNIQSDYELI